MKHVTIHPRLWALLDDACLLVFRIFGVTARPGLPGLDPRDQPWNFHAPWVCHYIHTGEAFSPTGLSVAGRRGRTPRRACFLSQDVPARKNLPHRGRCVSGLTFRSLPLRLGRGLNGSLLLGPWLPSPPTDRDFRSLCARLHIPEWDHMLWAWRESPVLPPARERELTRFCQRLFPLIGKRYAALSEGKSWEQVTGTALESIYPPLRLADDFPLRVFGVFVTYSTDLKLQGTTPPRPLASCDLEYVDRGTCRAEMGGKAFDLGQGQAILFLPRDRPRMSLLPGRSCETISVSFVANASLLADVAGRPFNLTAFQQTLLSRLCQLAAPGDDSAHRSSEVKLLLIQMLLSARERPSPTAPAPVVQPSMPAYKRARHGAALLGIRRILDDSAEGRVRLRDIARHANMSVPTLERLFKLETGLSPIRYHHQQRMERARLLLRHSMLTVTQIADRLGFQSVHHFSHSFKRHTGATPTDYARSVRGALRQIEEAKQLLREGMAVSRIAEQLGFPSVHAFAQIFHRYTGMAPDEFAHGKISEP